MKKLMLAVISLLCVKATASGQMWQANLIDVQIQPKSTLSNFDIQGGMVTINLGTNNVTLELYPRHHHCPPGMNCAAVMPAPIVYELPIVSTTTGGCQEKIYEAKKDDRVVDGWARTIKVVDNSSNMCESFASAMTEITLKVEGRNRKTGRAFTEVHSMNAEQLR